MTTRVAVIGSGGIARDHVRALAALPTAEVAYVVGSDLDRAASVAALAPGARATTDLDQVLTDPSVHAVNVVGATPDHAPVTIAAGRAGKHVHVEKPAALTVADFDDMVAATEGAGTSLMVGQTVRFQPSISSIGSAVGQGEIGDPRLIHLSWYTGHVWPGGWRGWQHDRARSGGHPVHNGTHALDLATWLIGRRPVRVFARSFPTFAAGMPVHDSFHLTVRFEDDSLALIELAYALPQPGKMVRRIVVSGTTGTLAHDTGDDPGLMSDTVDAPPSSIEDAMTRQMRHWLDTLDGSTTPIVETWQVRAALAAAVAAQQSLDTGRAVTIDHGGPR